MSVNKYMHHRNIYKTPPNFAKLALKYPEFMEISKKDINGKVQIDFKDPHSLRVLTKCLLHSDFGLSVDIPEDRLVPTLPLRLNYILWIEDLIVALGADTKVTGIDIGTGACAIYPLLGTTKNKWHMLGTECDEVSYKAALNNVEKNKLEHLINLKLTTSDTLLQHCFSNDRVEYSFCMCNPPFYGSLQELYESRSDSRPPPKNAFTGSLPELVTEGGEVEFITKLIDESFRLKERVKIYTTMVGHKTSLKELMSSLRDRGVQHIHTEFCQGHTTRWGLAWTFLYSCDLLSVAPLRTENRKKNNSMAFIMQPLASMEYNTDSVSTKVKEILNELNITYRLFKKKGPSISFEVKAQYNTWSNQRRKRRQQKIMEMEQAKKNKVCDDRVRVENNKIDCASTAHDKPLEKETTVSNNIDKEIKKNKDKMVALYSNECTNGDAKDDKVTKSDAIKKTNRTKNENEIKVKTRYELEVIKSKESRETISKNETTEEIRDNEDKDDFVPSSSATASDVTQCTNDVILHSILTIGKVDDDIVLDMEFLNGSAGKDGMHQVVQYIKNHWK